MHPGEWFRNLVHVSIRPRETMRELLDSRRDLAIIPLVLLATLSACLRKFDLVAAADMLSIQNGWRTSAFIVAVLGFTMLFMLGLFYLFAWVALGVGRLLEGTGDSRGVRAALAWGLAPFIWALIYRIPMAFTRHGGGSAHKLARVRPVDGRVFFDAATLATGWRTSLLLGVVELILVAWYVFVASQTLAEAHRVSPWRGVGIMMLVLLTPVVIAIAAIMTVVTS